MGDELIDRPARRPIRCSTCGGDLVRMSNGILETCMGFFSPPGHDHDDNGMSRTAWCAVGHVNHVSLRRSCHSCEWKGKALGWDGAYKFEEWPDIPLCDDLWRSS